MARTAKARRRRRGGRFTPRRWLPFVALTALVVGAAVVEPDDGSSSTQADDATRNVEVLPAVARDDALSTAWFCGGGSALGDDGIAELTIVLANDATVGAEAEVVLVGGDGEPVEQTIEVPANGRARLVASEAIEAEWVAATVEVRGGRVAVEREVAGPLGFEVAPCSTSASDRWYVPSGSTVRGADEYLSIYNPFPDSASVDIVLTTDTGRRAPGAFRGLSIQAESVLVVKINDAVDERSEVAATVRVRTGKVVVDRVQTYDGTGDEIPPAIEDGDPAPAPSGLISTPAVPVRAPRWAFPGARVSPGVRTQVAIFNPSARTAEVDVVLTPQDPERNASIEPVQLTIRPREQAVVDLAAIPGLPTDLDLWVDVRSLDEVPIVAERLAFFDAPSERTGATVAAGSPVASRQWMVVQGGATDARGTGLVVANPGPRDAEVTVVQLSGGNRIPLPGGVITVPAGDRRGIDLADAGPAATLVVASTEPVIVGSSASLLEGPGVSVGPALAYPESTVAIAPPR